MRYTHVDGKRFTEERALFAKHHLKINECVFDKGESPIKEGSYLYVDNSIFKWYYPFWYTDFTEVSNCYFYSDARAGMWYCKNLKVDNCVIDAPKTFRRCELLTLTNTTFTNAQETLWHCQRSKLENITATGDYFCMNGLIIEINNLNLVGKYAFDGCNRVTLRNCHIIAKDAFWNCEKVSVYDSFISGEYIGWNSHSLRFENCTIESLQGLSYTTNLCLKNCRLINTTLAFENFTGIAEVKSPITSVYNPRRGTISAPRIDNLIFEEGIGKDANIFCHDIGEKSDHPTWDK